MAISTELLERTRHYEGLRLKPYTCPAGKLTIGYGHNLQDNGITLETAETLLQEDLETARIQVLGAFSYSLNISVPRQEVLIDLCFNMGLSTLRTFKKMHKALEVHDHELAATELLDSKYATQVGQRAIDNANILRGHSDGD